MPILISETLEPKDRADLRKWFLKNHDKKSEIWLIFYKKSTGKQTLSLVEAIDEAICFGWIDGFEKGLDQERYVIRFTPRSKTSKWSERNINRYKELLKIGKVTKAGKKAFTRR